MDGRHMADWIALSEAKARYCAMLDGKDWDGLADLMTEDYEMDVSEGTGQPVIRGRDAALASVRGSIETARTAHQVHMPIMEIAGDEARVLWAMQDRVVWGSERKLTGYGQYHERWVRRNDGWKLAALRLTRFHLEIERG